LDIDPLEDIRVLVLLWKMGANEKPAQISKQEWMQGCAKLQVDSVAKFEILLPSLDIGFLDQTEFKDFYKFCFQFNRQGTYRTLDKELVVALVKMVLKDRVPKDRLDSFCEFVESEETYTRITLDQWTSFLDFCYECEDLASYDESSSAWPVLIDEYVEFQMTQKSKK
jgi:Cullin binding